MDMYSVSVPLFAKALRLLAKQLEKSAAWAKENGKDESELVSARLIEDMFPLSRQVQIASDNAKGICARLAGQEPPRYEDTEQTFAELIERCNKTVVYIKSLPKEGFAGAENREIPYRYMKGKYMVGSDALIQWYIPNFFFHAVTAYDILRSRGVPLGKADFLGDLSLHDMR